MVEGNEQEQKIKWKKKDYLPSIFIVRKKVYSILSINGLTAGNRKKNIECTFE